MKRIFERFWNFMDRWLNYNQPGRGSGAKIVVDPSSGKRVDIYHNVLPLKGKKKANKTGIF